MSDPGELKWSVRISARDRHTASVYARKRRFEVGSALSFDVEDERTSALEYVLGAVGADLANGMKQRCHRLRLEVDSVEALVVGELDNPLVHLAVVGERGHPGLKHLSIKVFVETLEEEDVIQKAWDEVLLRSPLYCTFSAITKLDVDLQIVM